MDMLEIPSFKEQIETKSRCHIRHFIKFLIENRAYEAFVDGINRLYTENNERQSDFLSLRPLTAYNFIDSAFPWEDSFFGIDEWSYLSDVWRSSLSSLSLKGRKNRK